MFLGQDYIEDSVVSMVRGVLRVIEVFRGRKRMLQGRTA